MKVTIPDHIPGLLNNIPEQDLPNGEEETKFWRDVAYELSQMLKHAASVEQSHVVLNDMRKAGSQYIWEFYVNDLALPKKDSFNWHGQNVSQWLYAGAIVLQDGIGSLHH